MQTDPLFCRLIKALQCERRNVFAEDVELAWQRVKRGMEKASAEKKSRSVGVSSFWPFLRACPAVPVRPTLQFASVFSGSGCCGLVLQAVTPSPDCAQADYQVVALKMDSARI
jgi:hypothetical protein